MQVFVNGMIAGGTLTDSTGKYTLTRVPPGRNLVVARAIGYETSLATITVAASETVVLDFAVEPTHMRMAPWGSGILFGRVLAADGRSPVGGAEILLADWQGIRTATDSAGRYTLTRVPEGEQVILVRLVGYMESRKTITVAARQTAELDFVLARAEPADQDPGSNRRGLWLAGVLRGEAADDELRDVDVPETGRR